MVESPRGICISSRMFCIQNSAIPRRTRVNTDSAGDPNSILKNETRR